MPLQPLFSTILAVLVLGEYPMPGQYLGAITIVLGLWLVLWANARAARLEPPAQGLEMRSVSTAQEDEEEEEESDVEELQARPNDEAEAAAAAAAAEHQDAREKVRSGS